MYKTSFLRLKLFITRCCASAVYMLRHCVCPFVGLKLAFHDADTDTDTDILADILARIVARMSACRSACRRNNFRKSRVSDMSARIVGRMSVSVSASWNSSLTEFIRASVHHMSVFRQNGCAISPRKQHQSNTLALYSIFIAPKLLTKLI